MSDTLEHDFRGCNTKITKGLPAGKLSILYMLIENVMVSIAVVGVLSGQLIMAIREGKWA